MPNVIERLEKIKDPFQNCPYINDYSKLGIFNIFSFQNVFSNMKILSKIISAYNQFIKSIVFIPALITFGLVFLAIFLNYAEQTPYGKNILTTINFMNFNDAAMLRALLSAMLTGTISLTVFSFSMVMVVVNQASSNYSPKVIEGFINKRANKVILGIYLGTILFIMISLIQIDDRGNFSKLPHFNVFSSIILLILCIGLFIFFIQNISNSVKITNVAQRIFMLTRNTLKDSSNELEEENNTEKEDWHVYTADKSGYFQHVSSQMLLRTLKKESLKLKVVPFYGTYLLKGHNLFYLNRKIDDEKILNRIRGTFNFYSGENVRVNYFYGYRQLREVAVKALSPGINDPSIAIICLDYLGELLSLFLDHEKKTSMKDKKGKGEIIFKKHSFESLLSLTISPVESYGKKDYIVLSHILKILGDISDFDKAKTHRPVIMAHANSLLNTADTNIKAALEREFLGNVVTGLNKSGYFDLRNVLI